MQLLVTQHLSGSNIASESAGVVSPGSRFSLLQVSRNIHLLCLQFVHPYLLIRDLIMLLKEVTPFFLYVTWLGIPHQWSRGADHLVSCPKEGYRVTTASSKLLVPVKTDSDNYLCTATNLLGRVVKRTQLNVVSLPQFTVQPPSNLTVSIGQTLTLNCSATGDPQPVISWKKTGQQLPVGRSQHINNALVIRDTKEEDAGSYICTATSAGFFYVETTIVIEVARASSRGK